jgi:DUF1365 family protein
MVLVGTSSPSTSQQPVSCSGLYARNGVFVQMHAASILVVVMMVMALSGARLVGVQDSPLVLMFCHAQVR